MTDRELMQMALDALEDYDGEWLRDGGQVSVGLTIEALRTRLAQPEPEPVAWIEGDEPILTWFKTEPEAIPLYTSPPASKPWVGLTDEEIDEVFGSPMKLEPSFMLSFVRAIEAKLKEKNT